jgi:hypothetical protein
MRSGQLFYINEILEFCNQPWKAALFAGVTPRFESFELNYQHEMHVTLNPKTKEDISVGSEFNHVSAYGNATWLLTQKAYHMQSMKPMDHNSYERALYGSLSGNYEAMSAISKNWEDFGFAGFKSILYHSVMAKYKDQCDSNELMDFELKFSDFYGDNDPILREITERGLSHRCDSSTKEIL